MTELDAETLAEVTRLRTEQDRSESWMIAALVKEAIEARREKAAERLAEIART